MEVLPLRLLHLAAGKHHHRSGVARMQTGEAAKRTRVATAAGTIAAAAGTLIRAAGEATVVKSSAGVGPRQAGRASAITVVPLGTAAGAVVSRAVELLALRVDATSHPDRTAAEAHLHHGAKQSRSTATAVPVGEMTGDVEP